jgi:hypothetical protein
MQTRATKQQILEDAGYFYSFDRMIYVNRDARKVFSIEYIQDHNESELKAKIEKPGSENGDWSFYFSKDPSDAVKRDLSAILG